MHAPLLTLTESSTVTRTCMLHQSNGVGVLVECNDSTVCAAIETCQAAGQTTCFMATCDTNAVQKEACDKSCAQTYGTNFVCEYSNWTH